MNNVGKSNGVETAKDIEKAKELLGREGNTCVLCLNGAVHKSQIKGIRPMIDFISSGLDLKGFSVADKIVGKAAAQLFALAKIKEVYAEVLSKSGAQVLTKNNIKYSYGVLADIIVNRQGTGLCPMEETVQNIDSLSAAYQALKEKLN